MELIKKIFIVILTMIGIVLFSRPVYGAETEGKICFTENGEPVKERVLFMIDMNTEDRVKTLIGALIYNKIEGLPDNVRLCDVFFDEGEIFIRLSGLKNCSYFDKGILYEQIVKTTCSINEIDSIIINSSKNDYYKTVADREDRNWIELTKEDKTSSDP